MPEQTDLERSMAFHIRAVKLPAPVVEHAFDPTRRWRFDFAWPDLMVACEVEGGTWMGRGKGAPGWGEPRRGGGHGQPIQFEEDCEKYGEAAVLGWTVIRVTGKMIDDGRAIDLLVRTIEATRARRPSSAGSG